MTSSRVWIVRLHLKACRQWLKADPPRLDRAGETWHTIRGQLRALGLCDDQTAAISDADDLPAAGKRTSEWFVQVLHDGLAAIEQALAAHGDSIEPPRSSGLGTLRTPEPFVMPGVRPSS